MKHNWEYKKLGDVCDSLTGLWTGKKEPFVNVAVIRNTNFSKDCKLKLDDVAYLDVEQKQYSTRKLLPGDIIVEKSGGSDKQPVGRVVLFDIPKGEFSFSNFTGTLRIKNNKELNSKFLHRCLVAHYLRGETRKLQSKTTGLHNLDMKGYLKLPIPVPPLSEQSRIVAELDLLTGIIDKQNAQLKELDNLAQAIFYDMFGDPIENPKGWEVKKLGDLSTSVSYGTSSPSSTVGKYKYLRMNNITYEGFLDLTDLKYINMDDAEFEKYSVREGDVLFNRTNSMDLIGKTTYIHDMEPMIIAGYIIRVRLADSVLPVFVSKFMNTPAMKKKLRGMAKGAVNQANINSKELKSIDIPIPPLTLQQSFAEKIQSIEKQKEAIRASIADTQKLLDYTMDKYFG